MPSPLDPSPSSPPRWTSRPLPPYRHLPGSTPHPTRDAGGHARDEDEDPVPVDWSPDEWGSLEPWLWGVDLFNHGYWWEAHEAFEGLWHAAGRSGERAAFVQALIHLSAACLNRRRGHRSAARRQAMRAIEGLEETPASRYMGLDIQPLIGSIRAWRDDPEAPAPRLALHAPPASAGRD